MTNISQLMKRAQEFQAGVERAKQELKTLEVIGESGAGLVKVYSNGEHYVQRVSIDPAALQEDKAVLEDLIAAAFNSAVRRVSDISQESMNKLTSGIDIAGLKSSLFTGESKDD